MYCMLFVYNYWPKQGLITHNIVPENKKKHKIVI